MKIISIIKRIRDLTNHPDYSRNKIARLAGVSENSLRGLHKDSWNPTLRTLKKIEDIIPAEFEFNDHETSMNDGEISNPKT